MDTPDFRPDLAFPKLTEEMVERLGSYGREEMLPATSDNPCGIY
jgi:thioredoxin reductase (NADPH)